MPLSRKLSAIAVATYAALRRSIEERSEVEMTSTDFFNPSGPRSFSMNSRTSRPRSPRLSSAGGGEDSHTLSLAAGEESVDRAHSERYRLRDDAAVERGRRVGVHGVVSVGAERTLRVRVHRAAESVEDASEEVRPHRHHLDVPRRDDLGLAAYADHRAERGEQHGLLGESDDLGLHLVVLPRVPEDAHLSDLHSGHGRLDDGADHLNDLALHVDGLRVLHGAVQYLRNIVERRRHQAPLLMCLLSDFSIAASWVSTDASATPASVSSMHAGPFRRGSSTTSKVSTVG